MKKAVAVLVFPKSKDTIYKELIAREVKAFGVNVEELTTPGWLELIMEAYKVKFCIAEMRALEGEYSFLREGPTTCGLPILVISPIGDNGARWIPAFRKDGGVFAEVKTLRQFRKVVKKFIASLT